MSLYRLKACVIITCASYYYVDCRNQGKIPKMKYMFLIRVSLIDTVGKHFYLKLNSPTNIIKGVLVLLITVYTTDNVLMTAFCIIVSPHQYLINITLYMHNIILYITFTKITFNLLQSTDNNIVYMCIGSYISPSPPPLLFSLTYARAFNYKIGCHYIC